MIQVIINGENRIVNSNISVNGLLDELELDPKKVAVEINLEIIPKQKYSSTMLKVKDNIEIIHLVGGGKI